LINELLLLLLLLMTVAMGLLAGALEDKEDELIKNLQVKTEL
jgi:hypothetical protein